MASNDSEGSRPVVGITAYGEPATWGPWTDTDATVLPATYTRMVVAAGGAPVVLPPTVEAADAVARLDAVVLSGGADVGPALYGAVPDPHTGVPRTQRDATELAVLERALAIGIPVLAVCRGLQLLNVAQGGTLVQHLPDVTGTRAHNPAPGRFNTVAIALEPGSRVAAILGQKVDGQCHHHQAIERLGAGLVITAHAGDGTIEGAEMPDRPFVVGVQWHPEQDDPRLFAALVAAARERTHT